MDLERPQLQSHHHNHRPTTTTSELFICFTSRLSNSTSMRATKSLTSPGRAADTSATLSNSLSRRLRHNSSLRASPAMFSSKKTKPTSGFDNNPEPSSPKVTCIGQVRDKTKKQGKKMRMRACRSQSSKRLSGGEASFRRNIENPVLVPQEGQDCNLSHRNQRWVHIPLTICDALRSFGAEFSCLFPCKSSCFSTKGGHNGNCNRDKNDRDTCGAVCRWLVEGEEGGRVVMETLETECSRRRSIFDDMEFKDEIFEVKNESEDVEEGRVSVCIPPKNALLLMRCRSDSIKMSALSQKIWEAPNLGNDCDDDDVDGDVVDEVNKDVCVGEVEEIIEEEVNKDVCVVGEEKEEIEEKCDEIDEMCQDLVLVEENDPEMSIEDLGLINENDAIPEMGIKDLAVVVEEVEKTEVKEEENQGSEVKTEQEDGSELIEDENQLSSCVIEQENVISVVENSEEHVANEQDLVDDTVIVEKEENNDLSCSTEESTTQEEESQQIEQENDQIEDQKEVKSIEKDQEKEPTSLDDDDENEVKHEASKQEEINNPVLPDCLLLMMCEPKLSMEVSKETWVCSTDFIRWLPERHASKKPTKMDGSDEPKKKKKPPVQPPVQPGRSSISFPAGGGKVANLIDQKLVKAGKGFEPLVLTRCKSAPLRSTAKIAPPELACSLWGREKGAKIEPHRPSFGATGVGF